ncbi:MAG: hypothetical protein ACPLIG_01735 [Candidatus Bathyarchaeales archaeon]
MRYTEKTKTSIFIQNITTHGNYRVAADYGESLMITVLFMCIILLATGFFSYSFGYNSASQVSYERGYIEGYAVGNITGYETGYAIFIEPQTDEIVTLTVGQPYWDRTRYSAPDYNDTIVYYDIIW